MLGVVISDLRECQRQLWARAERWKRAQCQWKVYGSRRETLKEKNSAVDKGILHMNVTMHNYRIDGTSPGLAHG